MFVYLFHKDYFCNVENNDEKENNNRNNNNNNKISLINFWIKQEKSGRDKKPKIKINK